MVVDSKLQLCQASSSSHCWLSKHPQQVSDKIFSFQAEKSKNVGALNEFSLQSHETHHRGQKSWLQDFPLQSEDTVATQKQAGS